VLAVSPANTPSNTNPASKPLYQELIEKLTPVDGDRRHAGDRQE
jgi:hypothetical protein